MSSHKAKAVQLLRLYVKREGKLTFAVSHKCSADLSIITLRVFRKIISRDLKRDCKVHLKPTQFSCDQK